MSVLPEPSEQDGGGMKADQEPCEPGKAVLPATPKKPRQFSKLVLLTASKDSAKAAGAKRQGVHCIMALGAPGPAILAKALLKTHPEAQRAIEAPPPEPQRKRSRLDLDADTKEDSQLAGAAPSLLPGKVVGYLAQSTASL